MPLVEYMVSVPAMGPYLISVVHFHVELQPNVELKVKVGRLSCLVAVVECWGISCFAVATIILFIMCLRFTKLFPCYLTSFLLN